MQKRVDESNDRIQARPLEERRTTICPKKQTLSLWHFLLVFPVLMLTQVLSSGAAVPEDNGAQAASAVDLHPIPSCRVSSSLAGP